MFRVAMEGIGNRQLDCNKVDYRCRTSERFTVTSRVTSYADSATALPLLGAVASHSRGLHWPVGCPAGPGQEAGIACDLLRRQGNWRTELFLAPPSGLGTTTFFSSLKWNVTDPFPVIWGRPPETHVWETHRPLDGSVDPDAECVCLYISCTHAPAHLFLEAPLGLSFS